MAYSRAAAASASLSIFVVTVRLLIDRSVLSRVEAAEVLNDAEGMLAQYGGESANAAIELLRSEIRAAIGLT
jgi:hypothetical protein